MLLHCNIHAFALQNNGFCYAICSILQANMHGFASKKNAIKSVEICILLNNNDL